MRMRIEGEMLAGHKYAEQHLNALLFAANEIMNDTNAFAQSALQGSPQQQRNHVGLCTQRARVVRPPVFV